MKLGKPLRVIIIGLIVMISALLIISFWRLNHYSAEDFRPPRLGPDIQAQLNWIGKALRNGAGEDTQSWYPEGYFFIHALYGSALVNQEILCRNNPTLANQNKRELEWVISRLESEEGRASFTRQQTVEYGAYYQGWLNRLIGGLLLLQSKEERDINLVNQFHRQSENIAQAITNSPTFNFESYPGECWPVDTVVALTSLRIHDDLYGTHYDKLINKWLNYTRNHLDPGTNLIPHKINAKTGEILQNARGSSLALMLCFLPDIDASLAADQYDRFRKLYGHNILDFTLFKEYPNGATGTADVDSGPLIFGFSPVATGVALAAARANHDELVFQHLLQLSEVLGIPITFHEEKRFCFGQLPVGDAFLVWGKTLLPWCKAPTDNNVVENHPQLISRWCLWTNCIVVSIFLGLGCIIIWRHRRRLKRGRR
jgi:hypothetical protein